MAVALAPRSSFFASGCGKAAKEVPEWMRVPLIDLCEDGENDGEDDEVARSGAAASSAADSASSTANVLGGSTKRRRCGQWSGVALNAAGQGHGIDLEPAVQDSEASARLGAGAANAADDAEEVPLSAASSRQSCADAGVASAPLRPRRQAPDVDDGLQLLASTSSSSSSTASAGLRSFFQPRRPQKALPQLMVAVPRSLEAEGVHAIFPEANDDFLRHLSDHGYAVLQGVLGSESARESYLDSFWNAMTSVVPSVDPRRPATWTFPKGFRGIVTTYGLPQADFAWQVRTAPRLRQAFAQIFGTEELVVSLDAVIVEAGIAKSKLPPWLHKDQRPSHPGLSVQAVYTHFASGPEDAGTCVVPGSHKITYSWEHAAKYDHLRAPPDCDLRAIKPNVPADSAVFFNSRLVHASVCGRASPAPSSALPRPARLGSCVAFAPRARRSEATRRRKEAAYLEGKCSSHWACDNFSLKGPARHFQILKEAVSLPKPPRDPARLAML